MTNMNDWTYCPHTHSLPNSNPDILLINILVPYYKPNSKPVDIGFFFLTRVSEIEMEDAVPCSSLAVESVIRVATAGGLYGFCSGPRDARRIGLSGVSQASYVAKSIGRFGFQCGLVSGIFTMTHCGLQRYRGRNDWVNALVGGAVAGAAVAIGTRRWAHVVGTAGLVSAFSVLANCTRTDLKLQQQD